MADSTDLVTISAEFRIKRHMILMAVQDGDIPPDPPLETEDQIDEVWALDQVHGDIPVEFRESGEETGLECEGSRNYESMAVAAELSDGTWVGWTYWYGGGKHGCAEEIPWIEEAYFVTRTEETRVVSVFAKADAAGRAPSRDGRRE